MKDEFEMYGDGVKPVKATGTRWIDHRIRAMQRLVDKYGLYCQHLQHAIPETKTAKVRVTLKRKFEKLIDAKVLLRSCWFVDVLSAAKQFSLVTQKSDIDIVSIVDSVESTKRNYEKLLRKFETDAENLFALPTLKSVINAIESDEEEKPSYQGQKLKYYTREKQYFRNHRVHIVRSILSCYEERYSDVYSETGNNNAVSNGDKVLFDVSQVFNSAVWPSLTKD